MLIQNRSALLAQAISKFNPEVFSHPIWVHFGKKEASVPLSVIDDLLSVAKNLQEHDPSGACQVLLICAFYQNYFGQRYKALMTSQQAYALAEHSGLSRESIWAIWGSCAICVQQGIYDQAANYLVDLQATLNAQNEWMLADFIDVVKQSFWNYVSGSPQQRFAFSRDRPSENLLALTFDWLLQWGYFDQASKTDCISTPRKSISNATKKPKSAHPFFSIRHWRDRWYSLTRNFKFKRYQGSLEANQDPEVSISTPVNIDYPLKVSSRKHKPELMEEQVSRQAEYSINVIVQMLGPFSITIEDTMLKLTASRGLSLLKYLLLHHKEGIPREVLMDIFWPDVDPDAARNNLNVAIHALRKELRSVTNVAVIRYDDGAYCLSHDIKLWLDVEEFEQCIKTGKQMEARNQTTSAVAEYEIAINLYKGDFLTDNPYDDWTVLDRERLRVAYLDTIDRLSQIYFNQERYAACLTLCQLILSHDLCREDTHCRLMQCYSRLGQSPLALRQYQICTEALQAELEIDPAPETTQLYKQIRKHERI